MKRVNHDRHSGKTCCKAPQSTGLGGMGVYDVRTLTPHQTVQFHQGNEIEYRMDPSDKALDDVERNAFLFGEVEEVALPLSFTADHQV